MQQPKFNFADVKFADGPATFKRAQGLYNAGKVDAIRETPLGYSATVLGTQAYKVSVSSKRVDDGQCDCYLGQHDRLCKHVLALALAVLTVSGKADIDSTGSRTSTELTEVKQQVTDAMRHLKAYTGPSRIWFSYQRKLATGAGIIAHAVSALPPSKENAVYLWSVVVRLDQMLSNRVDDSDGYVGECVHKIIQQLADYAKANPDLVPPIKRLAEKKTSFDFEVELLARLKSSE
jgi:hypothetical protein